MSTVADLPSGAQWLHDRTSWEEDAESARGEATWYMPWAAWPAFRDAVGGIDQTFTIGAVTYTRRVPLEFPMPTSNLCYAWNYHAEGEGSSKLAADGRSIEYDYVFCTVQFRTPPWQVASPYPLVTFNKETSADMTTIPGTALVMPSDGLVLNHAVGLRVPVSEFTLTFHQCASFNDALFDSLTGKVNSVAFYGKAPGTVQYMGASTGGVRYSNGAAAWTITHRFRWRAIPHNVIMRPDGAGFEAPVWALDNTRHMLELADLNALWFA